MDTLKVARLYKDAIALITNQIAMPSLPTNLINIAKIKAENERKMVEAQVKQLLALRKSSN